MAAFDYLIVALIAATVAGVLDAIVYVLFTRGATKRAKDREKVQDDKLEKLFAELEKLNRVIGVIGTCNQSVETKVSDFLQKLDDAQRHQSDVNRLIVEKLNAIATHLNLPEDAKIHERTQTGTQL